MTLLVQILLTLFVRPFRQDLDSVSKIVNETRKILGYNDLHSLPSGIPGNIKTCPLAVALNGQIGVDSMCIQDVDDAVRISTLWNTSMEIKSPNQYIVKLPDSLRRFVRDFDLGLYKNLIVR